MVRPKRAFQRHVAGLLIAALAATAVIAASPPASAQGLFDFFFRGQRRPTPPPNANAYADPFPSFDGERSAGTPGVAGNFCVRLCDGRYFPIQRSGGMNPAQLCGSLCPAAATRMFSGAGIDQAVANDGTRYASLRNAFAYRERVVDSCTCNGRDPYGLVTLNANDDPTLRPGDIVATNGGFLAYTSNGGRNAEFTPIESYPGLSPEWRQRLAQTRITPNNATPIPREAISRGAAASQNEGGRRVELGR